MTRPPSHSRRTVLQTLTALVVACLTAIPAAARQSPRSSQRSVSTATSDPRESTPSEPPAADATRSLSGVYDATVDRIVGEQVVVLVEAEDSVVEQFVFQRERLPEVEEGTTLVVFVFSGNLTVLWQK